MTPAVEITGVSRDYRGLRPLRIERLSIAAGEHVALLGLDEPAAETLVNLITGATLPDRGTVAVLGRETSAIADPAEWLAYVDRIGIVSERVVLLDAFTVVQNLALPFTLAVEPPDDAHRERALALAREVQLAPEIHESRVGDLGPASRARIRLARALALDPAILIVEHMNARVPARDVTALAQDIAGAARGRGAAVIAATADEAFARALGGRVLALNPATGALADRTRRGWFSRS